MTKRIVLGRRGDGTFGAFISKPGLDANTPLAADDLFLGLTQFTEQLLMLGVVNGLPATVPFGFVNPPYVFLTSTNLTLAIANGSSGSGLNGSYTTRSGLFARPYPTTGNPGASVQGSVSASQMVITGGSGVVAYMVYRRRVG